MADGMNARSLYHLSFTRYCDKSKVELAASTRDITAQDSASVYDGLHGYFETAQWTADGTAILTSTSSNLISGYIVPEDLLSPTATRPIELVPQATIQLPEPSNILAGAPYFRLAEPWTQQLLVSSRDHPIQLFYLASSQASHQKPASCYPLTKARSETFLSATSLVWPHPGSHFIAGSRNMLAKFDVSRTGEEPLLRIKTIPSERHLSKGGGVGMRGTVSSLSAQPPDINNSSLVAAGTWTRWIGLYDFAQAGACVATWSIAHAATGEAQIGGDGITQTMWSPCGRYLLLGERKSTGLLVYDVRVTGKLLGWLSDREALGNQRINCDVFPSQDGNEGGFEVWSGTMHGAVKVWEQVGNHEGAHTPSWSWSAARQSTVGSTCIHQSGTVVATCSGSWEFPDDNESLGSNSADSDSEGPGTDISWMRRRNRESNLKIWSIPSNGHETEILEENADDTG
ncbi:hypothetical protein F4819DRAFT_497511 [Hypoxylon fuscum]|nr:hypothetical protein F4819DRAFT_497511 [Hypoxylon fuscum]